ncbi:MAG TPA: hypothetical protein VG432_04050 [Gemmatimonadaceae bacterium]|nr:hypothetical protein [Gemmatimonadaceae bacterium]
MPQSSAFGSLSAASPTASTLRVRGGATLYRIYDVGYSIDLERAASILAARTPARVRPERREAVAIRIANLPITLPLGASRLTAGGGSHEIELSARIFDFGVVSLRMRVPVPGEMGWGEFVDFGNRIGSGTDAQAIFDDELARLLTELAPAVERMGVATVTEDYTVFRVATLRDGNGAALAAGSLTDGDVVPLLLGEERPLSEAARRELLPHRFSYYADDLAILTWDNALVIDPAPDEETDVQYVLEFANAQLLELRYYDALLDAELPRMYDRVADARGGVRGFRNRRFRELLGKMQQTVADSTEIVERVENSLKVTDDVYLARIYAAALEIFRGRVWRAGIDRKLSIIRETYAMLNDEAQAARSEALEIAIVLLIVGEIVMALFK